MDELNHVLQSLNALSRLSLSAQEALGDCLIPVIFKKKDLISVPGYVSDKILFVTKGAVREFFFESFDEKITIWFGFEGDLAVSIASFLNQIPSSSGFEAMEPVEGFLLYRHDLYKLYDEFHEIERLGRILAEKYLIEIEAFHNNSKFYTAIERFEMLISNRPEIIQRISSKHIATYLGISTETLSRIRSKKI